MKITCLNNQWAKYTHLKEWSTECKMFCFPFKVMLLHRVKVRHQKQPKQIPLYYSSNDLISAPPFPHSIPSLWNEYILITSYQWVIRHHSPKDHFLEAANSSNIFVAGGCKATAPNCSPEYFLYTTFSLLSGAAEWEFTKISAHSLKHPKSKFFSKATHFPAHIFFSDQVTTYNSCGSENPVWRLSVSVQSGLFLRVHLAA